jgi:hypothetical protein
VGSQCHATGWGKDRFGSQGEYQVVLKEIQLPVVNSIACQTELRKTRLGQKFKLDESFMCAGGVKGKDTCKGDGGSPLVCPSKADPNVYQQAGIVAWGIGCGEDATPGVYASVAKAVCWIDQVMTCQAGAKTGNFASYWSYDQQDCGTWLNETIQRIDRFRAGGGARLAPVFDQMKRSYQECSVQWVNKKSSSSSNSYIGVRIGSEDGEEPTDEEQAEGGEATTEPAAPVEGESPVSEPAPAEGESPVSEPAPAAAEAAPPVDDTPIHVDNESYIPDIVGDPVTVEPVPEKVEEVTSEAAVNFFEEAAVVTTTATETSS